MHDKQMSVNRCRVLCLLIVCLSGFLIPASALPSDVIQHPQNPRRLKVAVFDRPPYSFRDKDGNWVGLSIELWEKIAGRLGIPYDYVEMPLSEVYKQLHSGACDLSPAIAISRERADQVEFTEPYLFSHGAVLLQHKSFFGHMASFYSYLWNKEVLIIMVSMTFGMMLFSLLLVLVERRYEQGHFGGSSLKGFGSALWFSAVTMTTVGYGDKTPLSGTGRMITFLWMLVGVLLIALFTGTIASSITTAQLRSGILRFEDLSRFRVGCYKDSRMDLLLQARGIPARRYATPEGGFEGLAKQEINAYAGDSIALDFLMTHLAPGEFQMSLIPDSALIYSFATKQHLPELAVINKELLGITLAPDWRQNAEKWTGPLSF